MVQWWVILVLAFLIAESFLRYPHQNGANVVNHPAGYSVVGTLANNNSQTLVISEQQEHKFAHYADIIIPRYSSQIEDLKIVNRSNFLSFTQVQARASTAKNATWVGGSYFARFILDGKARFACYLQYDFVDASFSCRESNELPSGRWQVEVFLWRVLSDKPTDCGKFLPTMNPKENLTHVSFEDTLINIKIQKKREFYRCFKYPSRIVRTFLWDHTGSTHGPSEGTTDTLLSDCNRQTSISGFYRRLDNSTSKGNTPFICPAPVQFSLYQQCMGYAFHRFDGCKMKMYSKEAAKSCLIKHPITFAGDSRMKLLLKTLLLWLGEDFAKSVGAVSFISLSHYRHFHYGLSSFRLAYTNRLNFTWTPELFYDNGDWKNNYGRWMVKQYDVSTVQPDLFADVASGRTLIFESLLHDLAQPSPDFNLTVKYLREHYDPNACDGCSEEAFLKDCGCIEKNGTLQHFLSAVDWLGSELGEARKRSKNPSQKLFWMPFSKQPPITNPPFFSYQTPDVVNLLEDIAGKRLHDAAGVETLDLRYLGQVGDPGWWRDGTHFGWELSFEHIQRILNQICD